MHRHDACDTQGLTPSRKPAPGRIGGYGADNIRVWMTDASRSSRMACSIRQLWGGLRSPSTLRLFRVWTPLASPPPTVAPREQHCVLTSAPPTGTYPTFLRCPSVVIALKLGGRWIHKAAIFLQLHTAERSRLFLPSGFGQLALAAAQARASCSACSVAFVAEWSAQLSLAAALARASCSACPVAFVAQWSAQLAFAAARAHASSSEPQYGQHGWPCRRRE